jgi:alanyl-tRNA synthetase
VKIISEGSIGSNLRRLEAVTGFGPIDRLRHVEDVVATAAQHLGVPTGELLEGIDKRLAEVDELRRELKGLRSQLATSAAADLAAGAVDGVVVARVDGLTRDELRDLAVATRDKAGVRVALLGGAPEGGGAALVGAARADAGVHAGQLVGGLARTLQGGGNTKNPELAVAGGKDPSRLDEVLAAARAELGIAGS